MDSGAVAQGVHQRVEWQSRQDQYAARGVLDDRPDLRPGTGQTTLEFAWQQREGRPSQFQKRRMLPIYPGVGTRAPCDVRR